MRPLKIKPGHAITGLALSPDGLRLGVVQAPHGFLLLDAITGAELGHDTVNTSVSELSPTGGHLMSAERAEIRLTEVTTGRPFLKFQTGWTRTGGANRPPSVPGTSPLARGCSVSSRESRPPFYRPLASDAGLTADHRFAVGRDPSNLAQIVVCDLATEMLVAADLDPFGSRAWYESVHAVFAPDETRVVALTARGACVFDFAPLAT